MAGTASFDRERALRGALGTAVAHVRAELSERVRPRIYRWWLLGAGPGACEELARYLHDHRPRMAHMDKR